VFYCNCQKSTETLSLLTCGGASLPVPLFSLVSARAVLSLKKWTLDGGKFVSTYTSAINHLNHVQ